LTEKHHITYFLRVKEGNPKKSAAGFATRKITDRLRARQHHKMLISSLTT
jgi:hypothetical protein